MAWWVQDPVYWYDGQHSLSIPPKLERPYVGTLVQTHAELPVPRSHHHQPVSVPSWMATDLCSFDSPLVPRSDSGLARDSMWEVTASLFRIPDLGTCETYICKQVYLLFYSIRFWYTLSCNNSNQKSEFIKLLKSLLTPYYIFQKIIMIFKNYFASELNPLYEYLMSQSLQISNIFF